MDYGQTIKRAVNVVWENKYLIVLGILAALGSGTFTGGGGGGGGGTGGNGSGDPFAGGSPFGDLAPEVAGLAVGVIVLLLCVAVVIGLALWVISTIARGGLVAGVDGVEAGEKMSLSEAWGAAWHKKWQLLGIGLLPGIPGIALFVVAIAGLVAYGSVTAVVGEGFATPGGTGLAVLLGLAACLLVPVMLALSILRTFAERAAMLEHQGVLDSYKRGWQVLRENLGEAVLLFLIQMGIFIAMAFLLFVPSIIVVLCCLLWPLMFLAQGFVTAAVSAVWTLAYREWTGRAPKFVEKAPVEF